MMSAALKIVKSDFSKTKSLSLDDFPEYVAECTKLREIADRFNSATAMLKDILRRAGTMSAILAKAIDDNARAIIEDRQAPIRAVLEQDYQHVEHEIRVLRQALTLQNDIVDAAKGPCIEKIIAQARPTHKRMMADIREKIIALADALDEELDFRRTLQRESEIPATSWPALPSNVVRAIGSREAFSSGVNGVDRTVSEYLGRAWDFSRVTR